MQLKIGTKSYERFIKVPIPLTVKFYLFNVTNSEQVLAGLERPEFEEVGPFMFKQWRRRAIVDFEDYNRRLRYREIKTFFPMFSRETKSSTFDNSSYNNIIGQTSENHAKYNIYSTNDTTDAAEQIKFTKGSMLDPYNTNVTIINLPLLSALTKLAQIEEGFKRNVAAKVLSRLLSDGKEKILITKPVNQLLFDGYKVDLMEIARDLSDTLGYNFDSPLPKNMFGFFYNKNGTWNKKENGELTVFTGRNDSMNDFMLIDNWNDQKKLSVWPTNTIAGDRCNLIKGTDGSQFHPGVTKHQILNIFSPLVCASLYIKYKEDTEARGIPLLRFTTPAELFAAPKKTAKNACYCTITAPQKHHTSNSNQSLKTQSYITDSRCYLDGLMDLSLCQRGAPIAASSPHFYNGDPMLAMSAGLKPNKDLHETHIDIEPMTGSVFRAASRAQLNAFVEQAALDIVDSNIIGNMTPMVAPLLWLEEAAEIDEISSIEFKSRLLYLVQKARRSFIISIILGILLAIVVGVQYWYVTCYRLDKKVEETRNKLRPMKKARRQEFRRNRSRSGSRSHLIVGKTNENNNQSG